MRRTRIGVRVMALENGAVLIEQLEREVMEDGSERMPKVGGQIVLDRASAWALGEALQRERARVEGFAGIVPGRVGVKRLHGVE